MRPILYVAISAVMVLLLASPAPARDQQDEEELSLEEILDFGMKHEFALNVADRCFAIFYELLYDRRPRHRPFLDVVMSWARSGAQVHYDAIKFRIDSAQEVLAEMERLQVADSDRYAFSREYVRQCQADYIRAMADQ